MKRNARKRAARKARKAHIRELEQLYDAIAAAYAEKAKDYDVEDDPGWTW